MPATHASAVLGRRACALVAVVAAAVHGLLLGHAGSIGVGVLVVAMMAACLYCARDLWTVGSTRAWCIVAVMNLAMVAVHWSAPGHHHGQGVSTAAALPASTLMTVATTLSIGEAAVATAVLYVQSRKRFSSFSLAARSRGAI
jgi:hypothetical protein